MSDFLRLLTIICALIISAISRPAAALSTWDGEWVFHASSMFSESAFAPYRTQLLRIQGNQWLEADVLGQGHRSTTYQLDVRGKEVRFLNSSGAVSSRIRYVDLADDTLRVCLRAELTACDFFIRGEWPSLRDGRHFLPRARMTISWQIDDVVEEQNFSVEQVEKLFSGRYDATSPHWTRILHPTENQPKNVFYGLTMLTALVGDDPRDLLSYRGTLTLWAGIPTGNSNFVLPFARENIVTELAIDENWIVRGVHNDRSFMVIVRFAEDVQIP